MTNDTSQKGDTQQSKGLLARLKNGFKFLLESVVTVFGNQSSQSSVAQNLATEMTLKDQLEKTLSSNKENINALKNGLHGNNTEWVPVIVGKINGIFAKNANNLDPQSGLKELDSRLIDALKVLVEAVDQHNESAKIQVLPFSNQVREFVRLSTNTAEQQSSQPTVVENSANEKPSIPKKRKYVNLTETQKSTKSKVFDPSKSTRALETLINHALVDTSQDKEHIKNFAGQLLNSNPDSNIFQTLAQVESTQYDNMIDGFQKCIKEVGQREITIPGYETSEKLQEALLDKLGEIEAYRESKQLEMVQYATANQNS